MRNVEQGAGATIAARLAFVPQRPCGVPFAMKILLYIVGFFALIGFLLVAGCFKMVF